MSSRARGKATPSPPDVNALIANIVGGAVDLHMPVVLDAQQARDIQRRWEGTGN